MKNNIRFGWIIFSVISVFIVFCILWHADIYSAYMQIISGKNLKYHEAVQNGLRAIQAAQGKGLSAVKDARVIGYTLTMFGMLITFIALMFGIAQIIGFNTFKDSVRQEINSSKTELKEFKESFKESTDRSLRDDLNKIKNEVENTLRNSLGKELSENLNKNIPPQVRQLTEETMLMSAESVQYVVAIQNRNMRELYEKIKKLLETCCKHSDEENRTNLAGNIVQPLRDAHFEQQLLKLLYSEDEATLRGTLGDVFAHPFPEAHERLKILSVKFQNNPELWNQISRAIKEVEKIL